LLRFDDTHKLDGDGGQLAGFCVQVVSKRNLALFGRSSSVLVSKPMRVCFRFWFASSAVFLNIASPQDLSLMVVAFSIAINSPPSLSLWVFVVCKGQVERWWLFVADSGVDGAWRCFVDLWFPGSAPDLLKFVGFKGLASATLEFCLNLVQSLY